MPVIPDRPRCHRAVVILLAALGMAAALLAQAGDLPDFAALVERNRASVVNIRANRFDDREAHPMRPHLPYRDYGRGRDLPPGHPDPEEAPERAQGSGFVISDDGYILTNAHVVDNADEVVVRMADRREFRAETVGADPRTDIALLKIAASGLSKVSLGDPGKLKEGDWVLAIGSPFGFEQSVTAGIVSAKARSLPSEYFVPFIQTDVAINPGNSGGPLFNLRGEVVGVNSQIFSRTGGFMGLAFSIPIDVAMNIQRQLRNTGRVERGRIGVVIQEVSPELAGAFALSPPRGALVSNVLEGTPAAAAGMLQGDVVLSFAGQSIATSSELPRVVAEVQPGRQVPMTLWRAGAEREMTITVGRLPDDEDGSEHSTEPQSRQPSALDRLGLLVVEPNLMQKRQMKIEQGVMVERRRGGGGAAELSYGDVVEAIVSGGRRSEVIGLADYRRLVDGLKPGEMVSLLVRRGERSTFVGLRAD